MSRNRTHQKDASGGVHGKRKKKGGGGASLCGSPSEGNTHPGWAERLRGVVVTGGVDGGTFARKEGQPWEEKKGGVPVPLFEGSLEERSG